VPCPDSSKQAAFVAQRALELREEGTDLSSMAVLYRSHFHALELQLELVRRNIPFTITSGIRFFEQAHIKDVIAYVKLVTNPRDEISLKRAVQLLPGIGAKGAEKLWRIFAVTPTSRLEEARNSKLQTPEKPETSSSKTALPDSASSATGAAEGGRLEEASERTPVAVTLQRCGGSISKKSAVAWAQFVATIAQLEAVDVRDNAAKMITLVLEAGYEDYLKENYDNYRSRVEDLEQLASFARQFSGVQDFLSQLALLTNLEAEEEKPAESDEEQMRLSTIHQAKGLEFDVVFVIMLCDGLFPSERSLESVDGEEEERRLIYVAITRAKNELYLSYPLIRSNPSAEGDYMQRPSRFLQEIPPELLEEWNLRAYG
jgi:DNA helicase-2/ATP-dependent DNA helicase PcrA